MIGMWTDNWKWHKGKSSRKIARSIWMIAMISYTDHGIYVHRLMLFKSKKKVKRTKKLKKEKSPGWEKLKARMKGNEQQEGLSFAFQACIKCKGNQDEGHLWKAKLNGSIEKQDILLTEVNENKSNTIMESKGKGKYDRKGAYIRWWRCGVEKKSLRYNSMAFSFFGFSSRRRLICRQQIRQIKCIDRIWRNGSIATGCNYARLHYFSREWHIRKKIGICNVFERIVRVTLIVSKGYWSVSCQEQWRKRYSFAANQIRKDNMKRKVLGEQLT